MASGASLLGLESDRPTTVADEIYELLREFRGIYPLKRLFWELLGYDRRDETILFPASVTFFPSIIAGKLLASYESFHIYYVTVIGDSLDRPLAHRICRYFRRKHRDFAVLVSDVAQNCWHLAYLADDPTAKTPHARLATMALGDSDENLRRQARQLSRLRAYDGDDEPLSVLEVISAFDCVFTSIKPTPPSETKVFNDLHYLIQILNRYPPLNRRQEQSIIAALAATSTTVHGEQIPHHEHRTRHHELREQLILHNLRLCFMFAKRYANGYHEILDLFQEAVLGLHRAAERVDPDYGTRFSTYASYWIKQSIRRAKVNTGRAIRLPAYLVQLKRDWLRASANSQGCSGQAPTVGEIAAVLKLTRKRAALLRQAIWVDSLIPLGDQLNLDSSVIEQLIDERCMTPDDAISEADLIDLIYKQLNCLDLREVRVLSMRYGLDGAEERTLREVGEILNLTRERVRQIEKQALERLRCHLELFDPDATRRQCQRPRHTT